MTRIIITLALLALGCSSVQAEDRYSGVTLMRGTVVSVGRVDPTENIGTGFFVDANYTSVALTMPMPGWALAALFRFSMVTAQKATCCATAPTSTTVL